MPAEAEYLWNWFLELNAARGSNGMGPNPIGYSDIAAWASLTSTTIRPSEVRAIVALDRIWLAEVSEASEATEKKPARKTKPKGL